MQGVLDIDPATGTPRAVGSLDGFLTGPSEDGPARVALAYVRAHPAVFGLSAADLAGRCCRARLQPTSPAPATSARCSRRPCPVFGNGLKANVARDGRADQVQGSPGRTRSARRRHAPALGASAARARPRSRDVDGGAAAARRRPPDGAARATTFSNGDRAALVAVPDRRRAAAGLADPDAVRPRRSVPPRRRRRPPAGCSTAATWCSTTSARTSGRTTRARPRRAPPRPVDLPAGWLPNGARHACPGNNAHVYVRRQRRRRRAALARRCSPSSERHFQFPFHRLQRRTAAAVLAALHAARGTRPRRGLVAGRTASRTRRRSSTSSTPSTTTWPRRADRLHPRGRQLRGRRRRRRAGARPTTARTRPTACPTATTSTTRT